MDERDRTEMNKEQNNNQNEIILDKAIQRFGIDTQLEMEMWYARKRTT